MKCEHPHTYCNSILCSPILFMSHLKALDIVRSEVSLPHLVGDVHCIIEAMVGRGGATGNTAAGGQGSGSGAGGGGGLGPGRASEGGPGSASPSSGGVPSSGGLQLLDPKILPGVPLRVLCDPDRVRGVLLNLYTNAAKFTKQGHIGLRVSEVQGAAFVPQPPKRRNSAGEPAFSVVTAAPPAYGHMRRGSSNLPSMLQSAFASNQGGGTGSMACATPTVHESQSAPQDGLGALEDVLLAPGSGQMVEDESRWLLFEVFDTGGLANVCLRFLLPVLPVGIISPHSANFPPLNLFLLAWPFASFLKHFVHVPPGVGILHP